MARADDRAQDRRSTTRTPDRHVEGDPSVEEQVRDFEPLGVTELRAEWRRLRGTEPPRYSRDLLVRALAYHVQETAFGGLSRASRRRLQELASRPDGVAAEPSRASLRPGSKLVREWHGRTHVVVATETGFDYAGESYPSLT